MDSLVTQGLLGLVFVLSVALWSKSSSSPSTINSTKKSKKKKKSTAASSTAAAPPSLRPSTPASSHTAIVPAEKRGSSLKNADDDLVHPKEQDVTSSKANAKAKTEDGVESLSKKKKKKMALEEFISKSNEDRVEDLERARRGDAGEKDVGKDMIDKELQPETTYKNVVRIEPAAPRKSYALTAVDEGWENVGGKAKVSTIPSKKTVEAPPSNAWASSNPFAALPGSGAEVERVNGKASAASKSATLTTTGMQSHAGSGAGTTIQAQTKKQRQNAAKAQAKKQEKETIEAERQARLAQHKKQVEAERMKEFFKKQPNVSNAPASSQRYNATNPSSIPTKVTSKATINEKGSLVWD